MMRAIMNSVRYKVILVVLATNFAALSVAGIALVIFLMLTVTYHDIARLFA